MADGCRCRWLPDRAHLPFPESLRDGRNAIATFEMRRDAVQAMPSDVGLEPPPILRPDRVGCLPRESRPASKRRGMPTDRRVGDETHASTLRQIRRRLALVGIVLHASKLGGANQAVSGT